MMTRFFLPFFVAVLFFALPASSEALNVTLSWDPSTDSSVVGYKVYYDRDSSVPPYTGTDALQGPSPINVGRNTQITLSGLQDGTVYYFTVTAYNAQGLESPFPAPVSNAWIPQLLSPAAATININLTTTLSWTAAPQELAVTYDLYYGTDPNLGLAILSQAQTATLKAATGLALFGLLGLPVLRRYRRIPAALLLIAGSLLLVNCGGGGSDGGETLVNEESGVFTRVVYDLESNRYAPLDLEPGTTYYWRVVALDNQGRITESPIQSFTTRN